MLKRFRNYILRRLPVTEFAIEKLLHNDLPVYVKEGYGGRSIEYFPPYTFFRLHKDGYKNEAFERFCEWYALQYSRYSHTPKEEGGMRGGSLDILVQRHLRVEGNKDDATTHALRAAITTRVHQRFNLFDAIESQGYDRKKADRIYVRCKRGKYFLQGGHHRCAILHLLGADVVPVIIT